MRVLLWSLLSLLLAAGPASPGDSTSQPDSAQVTNRINLPYAFFSGAFGAGVGYIYGAAGLPQKQSMVFGSAMAGTAGSAMLIIMGKDIKAFGLRHFEVNPILSIGYFGEFDTYIDGNPSFPNERSGSHNSNIDNNVRGKGWDNLVRLRCSFLLPIGHGRNHTENSHRLSRGLLQSGASGGDSWSPFHSGKTLIAISPFFRSISIESDDVPNTTIKTNGLDLDLFWDNRDFPTNPSRGFGLKMGGSRDFGAFESSRSWTSCQTELDTYVSLGANGWLRQSVLALDLWAAYSPTWEVSASGDPLNNPPPFAGASLGGYWRMRGYAPQRFNDKAAIYYCLEVRLIPRWNPFDSWSWLQNRLGVQWVQFVPFVEFGRVADNWSIDELHKDMNWDAGMGFRFSAKGMVLRIDVAMSDEYNGVQMMVGQPFQF